MRSIPDVPSPAPLFETLFLALRPSLLLAADELGFFDRLEDWRSAAEVASGCGTHGENTRLMLDGLVASGLLLKEGGRYRNGELASAFLLRRGTYLGDVLRREWTTSRRTMEEMTALAREGPRPPDPRRTPGESTAFLADYQRAGHAQALRELVTSLPEFGSMGSMLDLGSGPGLVSIALAEEDPAMRCVLFDRPFMREAMEATISEHGMEGRMEARAGDFLQDDVGSGYGLILASFSLYNVRDMRPFLRRMGEALSPGGVMVSVHEGMREEGTAPREMVLWNLTYALGREDKTFRWGEIAAAMREEGWEAESGELIMPYGPVEAVIGRPSGSKSTEI